MVISEEDGMFILAMKCIQLQKQPAAASHTTTCRHLSKYLCGKGRRNKQQNSEESIAFPDGLLRIGRFYPHPQVELQSIPQPG